MIKVEKVNKYFNRFGKNSNHVINNTTLEFGNTGLVALLGPSGSGKTTLLNAVGGLDKVSSGNIYINGKKITKRPSGYVDKLRNLNIGYIFQDYKLIDNMTVYDNVALSLKTIGIKDKKEIDKRVSYVLERVGMYRFRKRPAVMLSGGERQRVGIARAIVKNPNIIIADEPTGNLDSKNSLEIMNIIKKISEDRLVILVTHEVNLAKFYADRIIEIEDGRVVSDYINEHENNLDYAIDNNIYLKDIKESKKIESENIGIDLYRDDNLPFNLEIVLKGNNIFIRSKDNRKLEIVDDSSSIQFIDDNYKSIALEDVKKYDFDFHDTLANKQKLRYSSIFNPLTFISNGFKKVMDYSFLKKILLIGFFLSGFFIMLSSSRLVATMKVNDDDFLKVNKNYLTIEKNKISVDEYIQYEQMENINYIIPGESLIGFKLKIDDYYQTANKNASINGSLSSISMITSEDIVLGRFPENNREIVLDNMIIKKLKKELDIPKMMGLNTKEDFLNRTTIIDGLGEFKIVGFVDLKSPSIYAFEDNFTNILYLGNNSSNYTSDFYEDEYYGEFDETKFYDYNLFSDKIYIKEGRLPYNDYEVIVNISNKEEMPLNKEIATKINDKKLIVVGYYDSSDNIKNYFVNNNMIKYLLILKSKNISVYPQDKTASLNAFREKFDINIRDSYDYAKSRYMKSRETGTKLALTSSLIVLGISLIEIILMLRSSFLSRIKEVGIYRAIGLKKKDIYIMFMGEAIAITTFASLPGVLISAYIFKNISKMTALSHEFYVSIPLVGFTILLILVFNVICGLYPVVWTLRKKPAQILSRIDVD